MPTATFTGALLGLAFDLHADTLRKRPSSPIVCGLSMLIGAWAANKIVKWDNEAQRRKSKKKDKGMNEWT